MSLETATVLEFRLDRELPRAAGFVLGLSGGSFTLFFIFFHDEGFPLLMGLAGVLILLLSAVCFTFNRTVRMDKRTGEITEEISALFWNRNRSYVKSQFRSVGIGMGSHKYYATSTSYFVRLIGVKNLKIPGASDNKQGIIQLAEQVGGFLELPVDTEPKIAIF